MRTFFTQRSAMLLLLLLSAPLKAVTPWDAGLTDLSGSPAQLDTKGHDVAIFLFWGSWCATCKAELKGTLHELSQKNTVAVFTVAMDQDSKRAEHTIEKEGIPFTVLRDPEKKLVKELKVFGVPHWAIYRREKGGAFSLVESQSGFDREKFALALKKA